MLPPLTLPAPLLTPDNDEAVKLVEEYEAVDEALAGGVAFTGSLFDTWIGLSGGQEEPNRFTDADVNAVALLSVEIPPRAVIELGRRRQRHADLLARVPDNIDLHKASAADVGSTSAASLLWYELCAIDGIGWVTAGKLLARKRPMLIPVYDRVVRDLLDVSQGSLWESLRMTLRADDDALANKLKVIGAAAGAPQLSVLRVFDVVCWRYGTSRR